MGEGARNGRLTLDTGALLALDHPSKAVVMQARLDEARWRGASALPAGRLVLEITESAMIEDREATLELLRQLRALGVRLALDDFGTGYSSLSYVQELPVDILKGDKSFVDPITGPGQGTALTEVVLKQAEATGLRTVAEGIESADQAEGAAPAGLPHRTGLRLVASGAARAARRPGRGAGATCPGSAGGAGPTGSVSGGARSAGQCHSTHLPGAHRSPGPAGGVRGVAASRPQAQSATSSARASRTCSSTGSPPVVTRPGTTRGSPLLTR